jgi:serine phosphatase RsbU (regulator of sigma subunit)/anti-sigma regulatory factor (Ser/Thr protein kinase)
VTTGDAADWQRAPIGLLTLALDGTVLTANTTFLRWVGREASELQGQVRLSELLSVGGRIFWETHLAPLLLVDRRVDEVALELMGPADRRPVLLTAEVDDDVVRVAVSAASERTRYERELLAARTAADQAETRVRLLQHTTAALSAALGVAAVGDVLLSAATGSLHAAAATLWLAEAGRLTLHGSSGPPARLPSGGAALFERQPVLADGTVLVPIHGLSEVRGALSVTAREDAGAVPLDLEFLTAVGQQAGLALDRANRYEHSAGVARQLQHALLALRPPDDDRFAVATAYRPGEASLEVGGDWYDVFWAEPGVLAVVVGDVVGRGLGAAVAMGQLRSAVRALAGPGVGPARLITGLDRFVEQVEAAGMATLAYVEIDLAEGLLRYSCAGHPPPLLIPRDGDNRLLWGGRSVPLGAFLRPDARPQAEVELQSGDRFLLYTDGLVERRGADLDARLELLRDTVTDLGTCGLEDLVDDLVAALLSDEVVPDDVCLLLMSWDGPGFAQSLSADLSGLSALRQDLRSWLLTQGVGSGATEDLVLAVSETVANAAEHGAGRRPAEQVRVRACVEGAAGAVQCVLVTVHDRGTWQAPAASLERGRGLAIMRRLVDEVEVQQKAGTTVLLRRRLGEGGL